MRVIEVVAPGLLTTVQDFGRDGFGPMGVSPSGAADPVALCLGNRLAGNPDGAAALEMTLLGGAYLFPQGVIAALAGSDFGATVEGHPVPMWTSFEIRPGQTLRVGPTISGARCYLCVQGGFDVPMFLGSASTHLLSGLGGWQGRAIRKGDVLPLGPALGPYRRTSIGPGAEERLAPRRVFRATEGPQSERFSAGAADAFFAGAYRVTEESNRMGLRLEGPAIPAPDGGQMITEGVSLGAIQVPAGGQPVILFVEQQTAGGYPKIANIISADMAAVGQLRPRDEIRFERVDFNAAREALREQREWLASLVIS